MWLQVTENPKWQWLKRADRVVFQTPSSSPLCYPWPSPSTPPQDPHAAFPLQSAGGEEGPEKERAQDAHQLPPKAASRKTPWVTSSSSVTWPHPAAGEAGKCRLHSEQLLPWKFHDRRRWERIWELTCSLYHKQVYRFHKKRNSWWLESKKILLKIRNLQMLQTEEPLKYMDLTMEALNLSL